MRSGPTTASTRSTACRAWTAPREGRGGARGGRFRRTTWSRCRRSRAWPSSTGSSPRSTPPKTRATSPRAPASIGFSFRRRGAAAGAAARRRLRLGITLTPTVRRNARIVVRQCYYSVPARFIGARSGVAAGQRARSVVRPTAVVAAPSAAAAQGTTEDLAGPLPGDPAAKPGALAGSTALAQARARDRSLRSRRVLGAARRGTATPRAPAALIEVLLLHRQLPHARGRRRDRRHGRGRVLQP